MKSNSDPSTPDASLGARPPRRDVYTAAKPFPGLAVLAIAVVVITALYFARDIFVPLVLAILLSFALGPLVMLLRRSHIGRVPSVIVTVLLAFLVIFGIGVIIGSQLVISRIPAAHMGHHLRESICAERDGHSYGEAAMG